MVDNKTPQDAGAEPVEDLDNSAIDGSQPSDSQDAGIGDSTDSSTDEHMPWDKDPRFKNLRQTEKQYQELESKVKDMGFDSVSDAFEEMIEATRVKESLGEADPDELKKAYQWKQQYDAWKADQEIFAERDDELPEERAARLEEALKKERESKRSTEQEKLEEKKIEQGWNRYYTTVDKFVDSQELDADKAFIQKLLGNQDNDGAFDFDVLDQKATTKAFSNLSKVLKDYREALIKDIKEGKITDDPIISPVIDSSTGITAKKYKSMDDRHKALRNLFESKKIKLK